jgi:hypothetical protein
MYEPAIQMETKHVSILLGGGLGNQLFQIAFGYALHKRLGVRLSLRDDSFECGQGSAPSSYFKHLYKNLGGFFTKGPTPTAEYKEKTWSYSNTNFDIYTALQKNDSIHLVGYWQSEQHFSNCKEDLRRLFDLEHPYMQIPKGVFDANPVLHTISKSACLVCVRRGDYLKHPHIHNPCGMSYYKRAMSCFPADTTFFILSDDLEWCKANFTEGDFVFLDIAEDISAFYVGTLFHNYIISNSTFYWWMSYFSICKSPRIIAPDAWISVPNYHTIYRSEMLILERPVEV